MNQVKRTVFYMEQVAVWGAALILSTSLWAATPVIRDIGMDANKNGGQVAGWIALEGENFDGTTTSVLFSANGGGTVAATNMIVSTGRGMIFCQVPLTAVTGDIYVVVDTVSSAGYPLNVNTSTFNPGANTISGQVTASGPGVPNVCVAMLEQGNCGKGVKFWSCATTDSSGYYTLYWPGSGSSYLMIILPPLSAGLAGTMAQVSGSGNLTDNFALTAGTTVTGTVHNPSGGALQNAYVSFDENGHDQIHTDATGNFSLHLTPGSWTMYVDPPIGYHAMGLGQNGVSVTVPATSPYGLGTISLQGGIWFSGTLQDDSIPTPQPVVAADLMVNPQNGGSTYNENFSRPGGTFGIEVQSGVAFQLNIRTARKGPLVDWQGNYGPYSADTNIGTITLGHAGFITGTVTDESATPLSDVGMQAFHAISGSWLSNTNTCSDGTYTLKVPSAGTTLPVIEEVQFWNDSRPYANQTYNNKIFPCEGNVINVSGTSTVSGINFTLHPGGSIAGKVTYYAGGAPVPDMNVQVDDGNSHNCALGGWPPTDSGGNYQFDHMPIMSSRVWVGNQPMGYSRGSYLNEIYPDYTPVTPVAGTVTPNINIPLWTVQPLKPVPNGVSSTAAKVWKLNTDGSLLQGTWDVTTCPPPANDNYSLLIGLGSTLSTYGIVASGCNLGTSGTFTGPMGAIPNGERFLWWVMVQTGGQGQTESSWGKNSSLQERNGSNASNQCQNIYKDTSQTCP